MQSHPSPTPSAIALDNVGASQQQNRKRQRSASMHSSTSSSPKRSQSQGVQEPPPSQLLQPSIVDPDTPMASKASDAPTEAIAMPAVTGTEQAPKWQDVPAQQKYSEAQALLKSEMKLGERWFLVSARWFMRWDKAVTGREDKEGAVEERDLGPVDNSDLLDSEGQLIEQVVEGENAYYAPELLWSMFLSWYGTPRHALPRTVIAVGDRQEPTLEIHPPRFKPLLLVKDIDPSITGPNLPQVTVSSQAPVSLLCDKLAAAFTPDLNPTFRVWTLVPPRTAIEGSHYPASRLLEVGGQLLQRDTSKSLDDALIHTSDLFAVEIQEGGAWIVDASKVPSPTASASGVQIEVPPPLFSSENNFFNRMQPAPSTFSSSNPSTSSALALSSSSKFTTPASSSLLKPSVLARPATALTKAKPPGTLGLGNMGNTCFMNSALQCLSHTKELVDYFLTGVFKDELNPDNPLGMHGAIAEAFGALLTRIWAPGSGSTSYSPREFKQALQRFAPQFSGYQQHDSQELVAFLLDGLHEDLNRILKKPFVEKPDWEGGGEKEMFELAKTSWDGYLKRNDSVIVDLFQGQYRSTLVCPECEKVSITFDPFMYLTLPLPVTKKWKHTIYYVPWDISKAHVRVPVEIGRDASFKELRQLLGHWLEADPANLVTMEIFSNRFYKSLDDSILCSEMADNDVIVCYELPCRSQQNRNYKRQPDDPFLLPVSLCEDTPTRSSYSKNISQFGYPFFIALDHDQAKDVDAMYSVIVDRLQRWTANARDLYTWEAGAGDDDIMEEVPIPIANLPAVESVTEIKENGDVVTVQEPLVEEGDIVDQRSFIVEDVAAMDIVEDGPPQKVRAKPGIFTLKVQSSSQYGSSYGGYGPNTSRFDSWDKRRETEGEDAILLKEGDSLFCEFDENLKEYYFGSERSRWEHAIWDTWGEFVHPELLESRKVAGQKKTQGITLQDCLTEFTKEEQLGEDDLWYCPQCKKHQQATKKFDLWKVPDVLVVHLKRFSNSRALRDKIDTFVDFPIEGLDLESLVEERKVAKTLLSHGGTVDDLGVGDLEEPLLYDLYAVDEHLGGLGGGHYRAYALNHDNDTWYHFDDSFVTPSRANEAVNANAYLLFYRRRTTRPLGGKTNEKIEEAKSHASAPPPESVHDNAGHLPTPPDDSALSRRSLSGTDIEGLDLLRNWKATGNKRSIRPADCPSGEGSPGSPPPLDDQLPSFEEAQFDNLIDIPLDPLHLASDRFDFPDPSSTKGSVSPSSSNEAEPDLELDDRGVGLPKASWSPIRAANSHRPGTPDSAEWPSALVSPSESHSESEMEGVIPPRAKFTVVQYQSDEALSEGPGIGNDVEDISIDEQSSLYDIE